jgi:leucyl-tRNA synthetase
LALENEAVLKWTEGKTIRKVIVVPGRLVNIAVS